MRASRSAPVQDASRGTDRGVRIHRGLLQPAPSSFLDRVSLSDRLRASHGQSRGTPVCRRARGRQGQALRAAPKWGRPRPPLRATASQIRGRGRRKPAARSNKRKSPNKQESKRKKCQQERKSLRSEWRLENGRMGSAGGRTKEC